MAPKTHDEKMDEAFKLVEAKVASNPTKTVSALVRKYYRRIDALRERGATYADICDAIKKNTGTEISVDTLTNVMSKFRNEQKRRTTGAKAPAKKKATAGSRR